MKIRISGFPFWHLFWLFFIVHFALIVVPSILIFIDLANGGSFDDVKSKIIFVTVYFASSHFVFLILWIIRICLEPDFIVVDENEIKIIHKRSIIYHCSFQNIKIFPDYEPITITDLLICGIHAFENPGWTKVELETETGEIIHYTLIINRFTSRKLIRYIENKNKNKK